MGAVTAELALYLLVFKQDLNVADRVVESLGLPEYVEDESLCRVTNCASSNVANCATVYGVPAGCEFRRRFLLRARAQLVFLCRTKGEYCILSVGMTSGRQVIMRRCWGH